MEPGTLITIVICLLLGFTPIQNQRNHSKMQDQIVVIQQEIEVLNMPNKVEIPINDLRKVGVMLFDFNDGRVIVLTLNEADSLTVVACTKDELTEIMKGSDYESK